MYIPQTSHLLSDFAPAPTAGVGGTLTSAYELTRYRNFHFSVESVSFLARWTFDRGLNACSTALDHASNLRKRSSADSVNTTIGVVVGVLLAVFLVGFFAFLYFYGRSIRVVRRKHRRRKSSGSKGSKNSEGAAGGEPPAPEPAPA
ncbi:hypothetical protein F4821DRAFT_116260 [Hypoxylon rubiginosum]|uniref:Uncharacterized protein n=1 Tax=Hypoxylon rubiginosum TaxID=110542 RepID=A0ACC0D3A9_9PEZI|nr:hypothetical protein F4821DRAFT_116260 [Hypoxylon rubiginosum]